MVIPIPNMTAVTVAQAFVSSWIAQFRVSVKLTIVLERQFESKHFRDLRRILGITYLKMTPYHPQAIGQIEGTHRQLKIAIIEDLQVSDVEATFGTTLRLSE